MTRSVPGVDVDALTTWWDAAIGERQGPLQIEIIAGGRSNLTYRVTDGQSAWALRRPPLGHVLPTAHDMGREFTMISALAPTPVPVADPVAFCDDPDVLGARFYVMSFVEGRVVDTPERLADLEAQDAGAMCADLVDTLVDLHAVDPGAVGLGEFGRPEGFLRRQVARWHKQWQASETRPLPELQRTVDLLAERMPEQGAPAIVHGDYRLTNCIYRPDLRGIAAVVDWEMATLGDPLTDVGLLVVYHGLAAEEQGVMPAMRPADGFWTTEAMVARYGELSGRDTALVPWYVGFGYFKLAVISEGIAYRYEHGQTVGEGFENFGARVPGLLDRAVAELESLQNGG